MKYSTLQLMFSIVSYVSVFFLKLIFLKLPFVEIDFAKKCLLLSVLHFGTAFLWKSILLKLFTAIISFK